MRSTLYKILTITILPLFTAASYTQYSVNLTHRQTLQIVGCQHHYGILYGDGGHNGMAVISVLTGDHSSYCDNNQ